MDPHEIWQENKRWILGVVAGLLVFWVGSTVIGEIYSTTSVSQQIRRAQQSVSSDSFFTREALTAAEEERDALTAERTRLERAVLFEPAPEFLLEGHGDPDAYFDQVSRRVRNQNVDRADKLGIELPERKIDWPSPVGEEIAPTLIAVNLLDEALDRLFDAHEMVRAWDPESLGLVAIERFKILSGRGGGSGVRAPRRATAKQDSADLILEDQVQFRFSADEATVRLFLEACGSREPRITLTPDFKMTAGRVPGEPLDVTGKISAVRLRSP